MTFVVPALLLLESARPALRVDGGDHVAWLNEDNLLSVRSVDRDPAQRRSSGAGFLTQHRLTVLEEHNAGAAARRQLRSFWTPAESADARSHGLELTHATAPSARKGLRPRRLKMTATLAGKVALVTGAGTGIGKALPSYSRDREPRLFVSDVNAEAAKRRRALSGNPAVMPCSSKPMSWSHPRSRRSSIKPSRPTVVSTALSTTRELAIRN